RRAGSGRRGLGGRGEGVLGAAPRGVQAAAGRRDAGRASARGFGEDLQEEAAGASLGEGGAPDLIGFCGGGVARSGRARQPPTRVSATSWPRRTKRSYRAARSSPAPPARPRPAPRRTRAGRTCPPSGGRALWPTPGGE